MGKVSRSTGVRRVTELAGDPEFRPCYRISLLRFRFIHPIQVGKIRGKRGANPEYEECIVDAYRRFFRVR